MKNNLLHIKGGMSSHTNAHLKIRKGLISLLTGKFKVMLHGGEEDQNINVAG